MWEIPRARGILRCMQTLVSTDSRGRAAVGRPEQRYLVSESDNGVITLEPAVVMTEMEHRFWTNSDLQARIAYLDAHPDQYVRRDRRKTK